MANVKLHHSGIKGMKWGVRRYQNKDGTLTPAGKKRYGNKKIDDLERRINDEYRKGDAYRRKAYQYERDILEGRKKQNDVDDKEWSKNIGESDKHYAKANKLQGELIDASKEAVKGNPKRGESESPKKKSVKEMTDDELATAIKRAELEKRYNDLHPKQISAGEKFVKETVTPALTQAGKTLINDYVTKKGKEFLGLKETSDVDPIKELQKEVNKLNLDKQIKDLKDTAHQETKRKVEKLETEKKLSELREWEKEHKKKKEEK